MLWVTLRWVPLITTLYLCFVLLLLYSLWPSEEAMFLALGFCSTGKPKDVLSYFPWNDFCFRVKDPFVCASNNTQVIVSKTETFRTLSLIFLLRSPGSIILVLEFSIIKTKLTRVTWIFHHLLITIFIFFSGFETKLNFYYSKYIFPVGNVKKLLTQFFWRLLTFSQKRLTQLLLSVFSSDGNTVVAFISTAELFAHIFFLKLYCWWFWAYSSYSSLPLTPLRL